MMSPNWYDLLPYPEAKRMMRRDMLVNEIAGRVLGFACLSMIGLAAALIGVG